jgi:hypothetical protein
LTDGHTIPAVNPLRRVFLGMGRLPEDLRASLAAEGLVLLEEGLPGTITYINYRAPGQYFGWRKLAFSGAIAITGQRFVVAASRGGKPVNVPLADERRKSVKVSEDGPGKLLLTIDPAAFDQRKSGIVEVRLRTPRAPEAVALLNR